MANLNAVHNTSSDQTLVADDPAWKGLADDVESEVDRFLGATEDLTQLLDQFEWEDDVPDEVQEAASDASLAVYAAAADVQRRLREFRAAVDGAEDQD
jgi:hypothetical protein